MFFIGQRVAMSVPNDIARLRSVYTQDDGTVTHWSDDQRINPGQADDADIKAVCEVIACANHDTDNPTLVVSVEPANGLCVVVPASACCPIADDRAPGGYNPWAYAEMYPFKQPPTGDLYVGPHDIDDFIHDYTDDQRCAWEHEFESEDEYDDGYDDD